MTKSRGDRVEICKKCRSISSLYKGFWLGLNFGTPGGPVEEVDLYCSQCSSLEPETIEVYARQCTFCSKGFSQGYLSGDEYFCNQECETNQCIKRQSCKCFEVLVKELAVLFPLISAVVNSIIATYGSGTILLLYPVLFLLLSTSK